METTEKVFKPMILGTNKKRINEVLRVWAFYIDSINEVAGDICGFLEVDKISYEVLIKLLNDGADKILVSLHKIKNDYPDKMDLEKMVNLGLVSNFYSEHIKRDVVEYLKSKRNAEEVFTYNISLLINEYGIYELNEDFNNALNEAFTKYTKREEENEALLNLELIIKGLNHFIGSKIKIAYGTNALTRVIQMIKTDDARTKFEVNPERFMRE